jgi:hypothetical protein
MSYNISDWETKKLNNLVIPVKALLNGSRFAPAPPPMFDARTGKLLDEVTFNFFEGEIRGKVIDEKVHVSEIYITSGHDMKDVIIPALKQSTGELVANLTWEGGDTFEKLIVKDGHVEQKNVEW